MNASSSRSNALPSSTGRPSGSTAGTATTGASARASPDMSPICLMSSIIAAYPDTQQTVSSPKR